MGCIGAFSVGALNAVTADEDAKIVNGDIRTRQTVEPLAGYSVVRARREFTNQSSLGFLVTSTNRNLDAATRFLPGQEYTGGMDVDWRLGPNNSIRGSWPAPSPVRKSRSCHRGRLTRRAGTASASLQRTALFDAHNSTDSC